MKTKYTLVIVIIFILTFTVACGSGTEAPPATADAITEAPTEAPVEEPVAEEPTAEEIVSEEPTEVPPTEEVPTEAPTEIPIAEVPAEAPEFLLPDDASNVIVVGEGVTTFQTALSIPDVMTFYRFGFIEYTERDALTEFSEDSFQIIFDGHESGKAVIVQGFPLAEGVVRVSIRLGDV